MVYAELRRLARHLMAREPTPQTLQPTSLVHEAWLRIVQTTGLGWNSRNHFFMAAATAMRRILIERARKKARLKRGGGWQRVPLAQVNVATDASPEDLLLVDEALEQFARVHPARAELVSSSKSGEHSPPSWAAEARAYAAGSFSAHIGCLAARDNPAAAHAGYSIASVVQPCWRREQSPKFRS